MPLADRAEFEQLLTDYAAADQAVNRAHGNRHDAMHACIDWVTQYARRFDRQ